MREIFLTKLRTIEEKNMKALLSLINSGHDLLVSEEIADNNRLQAFIKKKIIKALRNVKSYNVIKPEDKLKK